MPRYYCDYCDTYLTHDSPSVRKQHNAGYKHKANVRIYYQQYEAQLNQSLIDQKVKEHLGAFRPGGPPVGLPYNQLRPGVPMTYPPGAPQMPMPMPMPGTMTYPPGAPVMSSFRLPILPRPPPGAPGYMPSTMPMMMMAPPSAPLPGQPNDIQRPVNNAPPSTGMPPSSGAPSFYNPLYQVPVATSASNETSNTNAQSPEASD